MSRREVSVGEVRGERGERGEAEILEGNRSRAAKSQEAQVFISH